MLLFSDIFLWLTCECDKEDLKDNAVFWTKERRNSESVSLRCNSVTSLVSFGSEILIQMEDFKAAPHFLLSIATYTCDACSS